MSLLAFFLGAGLFVVNFTPATGQVTTPPEVPTDAYGACIVSCNDCRDCHGEPLDGYPSGSGSASPILRLV